MSYWWESVPLAENAPKPESDEWWRSAPEVKAEKPWRASILPISTDERGNVRFDSEAGVLGAFKRALTLPGQAYRGEVNPASDEGIARAIEMATVFSPATPSTNSWTYGLGGKKVDVAPPSAEALRQAGSQGFKDARALNVDYSSKSVSNMASQLRRSLEDDGIVDGTDMAKVTFGIIKRLEDAPEGSVAPFAGVYAARRAFQRMAKSPDGNERYAATMGIKAVDEFLAASRPEDVVSGPAHLIGPIAKEARGNYSAGARSEQITGIAEGADLKAAATNSGRNLDNSIRTRVAGVLDPLHPNRQRGFSQQELAALDEVARGTNVRNALRATGNYLGGGGGLGAVVAGGVGGAAAAGPYGGLIGTAIGLGIPAVGWGAKSAGNKLTAKALNQVDEIIRQRSPLFQQMQEAAPLQTISPMMRSAPLRGVIGAELEGANASNLPAGGDMGAVRRAAQRVSSPLHGALGKGGAALFANDLVQAAMAGGASSKDVANRLREVGVPPDTISRVIETAAKSGLLTIIDE